MKKARDRWAKHLTAGLLVLSCLVLRECSALRATSLFKTTSTSTTPEPTEAAAENSTAVLEDGMLKSESTTKSTNYTWIPQIDYIHDPNLPRELNGYNLSSYPFLETVPPPDKIDFKCDGLHDGFYAGIPYKCQVYHQCLYGTRYDFLCANYTAFDQKTFICHFVSEVDCINSPKYYSKNDALYEATTTSTTKPPSTTTIATTTESQERRRPNGGRRRPPSRRRRPQYDYYDDDYYPSAREQDDYYEDDARGGRPYSEGRGTGNTRKRKRPRPAQRRPAYDEYDDDRYDRRQESRTRQEEVEYEDRRSYDRPRKTGRRPNTDDKKTASDEDEIRPRDRRPPARPSSNDKKEDLDRNPPFEDDRRSFDDERKSNERPRRPFRDDSRKDERPLRGDDRKEERPYRNDDRREDRPYKNEGRRNERPRGDDKKEDRPRNDERRDDKPFRDNDRPLRDERPMRDEKPLRDDRPLRDEKPTKDERPHRDSDRRDERPFSDRQSSRDDIFKNAREDRPFRDELRPAKDSNRPFREDTRPQREDARPSKNEGRSNRDEESKKDESRSYNGDAKRNDYHEESTASSAFLVTPTGSSIYSKPRVPPRIPRPVPNNEKNKYKYVTVPTTTSTQAITNDEDYYDDDYDLDDPKSTTSSSKSSSHYRAKEIDDKEPIKTSLERTKPNFESDTPKRTFSGVSSVLKNRRPENIESRKPQTADDDLYEDDVVEEKPRNRKPIINRDRYESDTRYPSRKRPVKEEEYYDEEEPRAAGKRKENERYFISNRQRDRVKGEDDYDAGDEAEAKNGKPKLSPFLSRNKAPPTTATTTTTVATTEPTYMDDKDSGNKNSPYVRVVKRPFLPSRGGSPYLPRGLQPLGGKNFNKTTVTTSTTTPTTENNSPAVDYSYETDYDIKDERPVPADEKTSAEVISLEKEFDGHNSKHSIEATHEDDRENKQTDEEKRNNEYNPYKAREQQQNGQRTNEQSEEYKNKNNLREDERFKQDNDEREENKSAEVREQNVKQDKDYNQSDEVIYKDSVEEDDKGKNVQPDPPSRGKVQYEPNVYSDYKNSPEPIVNKNNNQDSKPVNYYPEKKEEVFKASPQIPSPYKPTNKPYTPKIPENISIKQNLADSIENDYDVTLNDALNPTLPNLTPIRNFPSPFIMPADRDYSFSRFRNPYQDSGVSATQNYPNYSSTRQQSQKYEPQRYLGSYKSANKYADSSAAGSELVGHGISVRTPQSFYIQQPNAGRYSGYTVAGDTSPALRSGHVSYRQVHLGDFV